MVGAGLHIVGDYRASLAADVVVPGVRIAGVDVGGWDRGRLNADTAHLVEEVLAEPLTLRARGEALVASPRDLGARVDARNAIERALVLGRSGILVNDVMTRTRALANGIDVHVGMRFDERRALAYLDEVAPRFEAPSLPTRLDLDARRVVPAQVGTAMLPHDSLSRVAVALASGAAQVDLVVKDKPPLATDPLEDRMGLDIDTVLGRFSTSYRTTAAQRDRSHNLKLGSAAIDGVILDPGETFSFNEVVGDRTLEAGYRFAPGINSGEIVDVVGGGICQVASSVFAAGFFAGLDIVSARPHSRPSTYVDMGLDATVVYPTVDLKLRNPYDVPVVFHVTARSGVVEAAVLGPSRDFQTVFGREIEAVVPFGTVTREDPRIREGHARIAQRGRRGFSVVRRRQRMVRGEPTGAPETWRLEYPPTREIVREGSGAEDAEVPEPQSFPPLKNPRANFELVQ